LPALPTIDRPLAICRSRKWRCPIRQRFRRLRQTRFRIANTWNAWNGN